MIGIGGEQEKVCAPAAHLAGVRWAIVSEALAL